MKKRFILHALIALVMFSCEDEFKDEFGNNIKGSIQEEDSLSIYGEYQVNCELRKFEYNDYGDNDRETNEFSTIIEVKPTSEENIFVIEDLPFDGSVGWEGPKNHIFSIKNSTGNQIKFPMQFKVRFDSYVGEGVIEKQYPPALNLTYEKKDLIIWDDFTYDCKGEKVSNLE